jgi:hypothetical protein
MCLLAQGNRVSKGSQRGEAGLSRTHAAGQIVVDLPVDVIAQLFGEVCLQAVAMK